MMSCDKEQKGPSVHSDVVWSHDYCAVFKGDEDILLCLWMQAHAQTVSLHISVCVCVCFLCLKETRSELGGMFHCFHSGHSGLFLFIFCAISTYLPPKAY